MENTKRPDLKLPGLPVKTPVSRNVRTQAFFIDLCEGGAGYNLKLRLLLCKKQTLSIGKNHTAG